MHRSECVSAPILQSGPPLRSGTLASDIICAKQPSQTRLTELPRGFERLQASVLTRRQVSSCVLVSVLQASADWREYGITMGFGAHQPVGPAAKAASLDFSGVSDM